MEDLSLWKKYPDLLEVIKHDHRARNMQEGHDFYHALVVAQYALLVSEEAEVAELAWVAGLCHNTDRIFASASDAELRTILEAYLTNTALTETQKEVMIDAVLEHSKLNDERDSAVTIALKDADRLANLDASHLIRAGQFRPHVPVFDPRYVGELDPTATFRNPKSVIGDLHNTLAWEAWFRLPKSKLLAKTRCEARREYIATIEQQLAEAGLQPFPPELLA